MGWKARSAVGWVTLQGEEAATIRLIAELGERLWGGSSRMPEDDPTGTGSLLALGARRENLARILPM